MNNVTTTKLVSITPNLVADEAFDETLKLHMDKGLILAKNYKGFDDSVDVGGLGVLQEVREPFAVSDELILHYLWCI